MMKNASVQMDIMIKVNHVCLVIPNRENIKSFVTIKIVLIMYGLHQRNAMMAIK